MDIDQDTENGASSAEVVILGKRAASPEVSESSESNKRPCPVAGSRFWFSVNLPTR